MSTTQTPGDAIPELWDRIVEAIVDGPTAWGTPGELAEAIGMDEEATLDELASMDVAGLLDLWERPVGIAVTLSVLAADRFGLRLVEHGPALQPRWAREGDPEPPAPRAYHVMRSAETASFAFLEDPRPGPDVEAERGEASHKFLANGAFGTIRRGAGRGEPPRPTSLIGTGLVSWPGPDAPESSRCPACGSGPLPAHAYCLCCDRWGLDATAAGPPRRPVTARNPDASAFRDPDHRPHAAQLDRQRRRDRRRSKMILRVERLRGDRPHDRGHGANGAAR